MGESDRLRRCRVPLQVLQVVLPPRMPHPCSGRAIAISHLGVIGLPCISPLVNPTVEELRDLQRSHLWDVKQLHKCTLPYPTQRGTLSVLRIVAERRTLCLTPLPLGCSLHFTTPPTPTQRGKGERALQSFLSSFIGRVIIWAWVYVY